MNNHKSKPNYYAVCVVAICNRVSKRFRNLVGVLLI